MNGLSKFLLIAVLIAAPFIVFQNAGNIQGGPKNSQNIPLQMSYLMQLAIAHWILYRASE